MTDIFYNFLCVRWAWHT